MAVIMKMRKRGGLIVALIGVAIVSFLAMDALNSNLPIINRPDTVGKIGGETISLERYARARAQAEEKVKFYSGYWAQNRSFDQRELHQINDMAWNQMVEDELLEPVFESLGLVVTDNELNGAIFGNASVGQPPAQEITTFYSQFLDDGTGFNPQRLSEYRDGVGRRSPSDPNYATLLSVDTYFGYIERDIRRRIRQQKYVDLFQRSIYVPDWMAQQSYTNQNQRTDIRYVMLPYASIADSLIKPTDSQLKDYLKRHASEYEQEVTRDIQFVMFDAFPTPEDTALIVAEVASLFERFLETTSDSLFVSRFSEPEEFQRAYDPSYRFKDDIRLSIADTLFTAGIGTFFGPYIENNRYNITKLIDRQVIPDSVKLRHILIGLEQDRTREDAFAEMDSVIAQYRSGVSFDTLAVRHSDDQASGRRGGDLGWWKPEDRYFQNLKDSAFMGKNLFDTFRIVSANGVHFMQVMEIAPETHEGVRYANLQKRIQPSPGTIEAAYSKAKRFKSKVNDVATFDQAAKEMAVSPRPAMRLTSNTVDVPGIDVPARAIIRWAFNGKVGESQLFGPSDLRSQKYVVAVISGAHPKGVKELEDVRDEITPLVIRELKKESLLDDARTALAGSATLEDVAGKLGLEVDEATGVSFDGRFIQGVGAEPNVSVAAQALDEGKLSRPIPGSNGVFVIHVTTRTAPPPTQDYSYQAEQIASELQNKTGPAVLESITRSAKVEDLRYKYY